MFTISEKKTKKNKSTTKKKTLKSRSKNTISKNSKYYALRGRKKLTFASYIRLCVEQLINMKQFRDHVGMSKTDFHLVMKKMNSTTEEELNNVIESEMNLYDTKLKRIKGGNNQKKERLCGHNKDESGIYIDVISKVPLKKGYQKIGRYCYNKDTINGILNMNNGYFVDPFTRETYSLQDSFEIAHDAGIGWKRSWENVDNLVYREESESESEQELLYNEREARENINQMTETIFSNPQYQFVFFNVIGWLLIGIDGQTKVHIFLLLNTILAFRADYISENMTVGVSFFNMLVLCAMNFVNCMDILLTLKGIFELLEVMH